MVNRYIIFCFAIVLVALGLCFYPKSSDIKLSIEDGPLLGFSEGIARKANSARVEVAPSEVLKEVNIQIRAAVAPTVTKSGEKIEYPCAENRCVVSFWTTEHSTTNVSIQSASSESQFTIESIMVSKEKYQSAITGDILREAMILLLLFYPIYLLLYKKVWLSQWLLIALSAYLLAKIQLTFSLTLAIYLLVSFFAPKAKSEVIKIIFKPIFILASVLLLFIFFKFVFLHFLHWSLESNSYSLVIPVGLSYFLLRLIDTQLKWYRGELKHTSLREYLLFVIFLPTIPAGPIDTLDNFIRNRIERISQHDMGIGLARILIGLFQKFVLADFFLAPLLGGGGYDTEVHVGPDVFFKLFFTFLFIYMDFSAYTNIAIGLSRLLGYKIIENFNWPILAVTPRDFWRRWHISLSVWCMRNVYFPLIIKTKNAQISIFMVMLTIGMWHATSASWFLWAVHHSVGIWASGWIEKYLTPKIFPGNYVFNILRTIPTRIITLIYICAGYSFAQFSDVRLALNMYQAYWEYIVSPITRLVS